MNNYNKINEETQVNNSSEELENSSSIGLDCRAEETEEPGVGNSESISGQSNNQTCSGNNRQNHDSNWESNYKELEINKVDEKSPYYHDDHGSLWKKQKGASDDILGSQSYIEVVALRRDISDSDWGVSIKFINRDNVVKEITIPYSILEDQKETIKKLVNEGLNTSGCERKELIEYLQYTDPKKRITEVNRAGWIIGNGSYTNNYICPSFQITNPEDNNIYEFSANDDYGYAKSGTLEEWQEGVCRYCEGNHVLTLALCSALTGPVLKCFPTMGNSMIHLTGKSSMGKTTALQVAGSLWGDTKFIRQWRVTSNALEGIAEAHNDGCLILDELSQVSSKDIGNIVYMLRNERGKGRMTSDINIRRTKAWRMSGLSSGEIGIADKIEEEKGAKARAGQLVRALDIDAQVSEEYGIYNDLHNFKTGAELSNHLKEAAAKCYGVPAEEFVRRLLEHINRRVEEEGISPEEIVRSTLEDMKRNITERCQLGEGVDGQVQRVTDAFALWYTIGNLASSDCLGVFTHNTAGIEASIFATFGSWLKDRGGKAFTEERIVFEAIVDFLAQNGHSFSRDNQKRRLFKRLARELLL